MHASYQSTLVLGLVIALGAARISAQTTNNEVIDGFRDTPLLPGSKWRVHDPDRPQPPVVNPGASFSLGAPAPADAEVLFDGKDLAKWQTA